MDRVYLHWNIINWITVVLMAGIGMFAVGFVGSAVKHYREGGEHAVTKYIPLNFALMSNPINWIIITLMVLLAGMAFALVFHPGNSED